jgi:hypothetical protein
LLYQPLQLAFPLSRLLPLCKRHWPLCRCCWPAWPAWLTLATSGAQALTDADEEAAGVTQPHPVAERLAKLVQRILCLAFVKLFQLRYACYVQHEGRENANVIHELQLPLRCVRERGV